MDKKRKRTKLQCQCGSIFDDDFRVKHERIKHSGRRTPVKLLGAPENPFIAAKRQKNVVCTLTLSN